MTRIFESYPTLERPNSRVPLMDVALVRHVAMLAELSLTSEEEKRMAEEIGRILAYVKELDAIDTTNVPATAHVGISGGQDAWRADQPCDGLSREDALRGAPQVEHDGFVVPRFVEE
jgi:aspartyl-tRNA(Asn)/glutamyl-tRNA(Gln) amidotransferase subunit C